MKNFDLNQLLRPNVRTMKAYSSARDEFEGEADIFLDANENPFPTDWNRYPDPLQRPLKRAIADRLGIQPEQLFLGNGSDEAIDLLMRAVGQPGEDQVLICPPTYGMYTVSANLNDLKICEIPLDAEFQPDLGAMQALLTDPRTKLTFLCSPNNPTGNLMALDRIRKVAEQTGGWVVVDEAYIDFAPEGSALHLLESFPNLVVLRTFSKAWGLAGLRLGMAIAHPETIAVLNRIKPPYNVNTLTQQKALEALASEKMPLEVGTLNREKALLKEALSNLPEVVKIYPSDANFLLAQFQNPLQTFEDLKARGIVVRNRSTQVRDCLRITVGTPQENRQLIQILEQLYTPNFSIH